MLENHVTPAVRFVVHAQTAALFSRVHRDLDRRHTVLLELELEAADQHRIVLGLGEPGEFIEASLVVGVEVVHHVEQVRFWAGLGCAPRVRVLVDPVHQGRAEITTDPIVVDGVLCIVTVVRVPNLPEEEVDLVIPTVAYKI